ncbi:SusD/RagB family nutrient-binding outer membrane lipoprotein [Formosa algae]|uniref:SusD/RagB family nutrient-binding outer membrane lipoprotein n=1 Tax=Formosa algae TaxID=225843 RepID=UPI000CCF31E7|nr:SusD/RagB family nutrient-binding outer membrane lipoprotein [Formosa algae]PNW29294.1 hypothetical protein BKP44_04995 [Formosa algae]
MKKLKYIFLLATILPMLVMNTSCDTDFEEINTNPNDPATVPSTLLLAGILRSSANEVQNYFLAGEAASCWVQHLGKPVYNDSELYIPRQGSIETFWNVFYVSNINNANLMQGLAEEEGNNDMQGIALVMKAYAYQLLTDTFGDVPYTEAGQASTTGNTTPVYDDSEIVYAGILDMLDDAMALLDGTGTIDAGQDLLYAGDYMSWKRFAASLKFRVLMRVSKNASAFNVESELQALVDSGLLFTSNTDQAALTFLSVSPNANPYFEGLVDGGRTNEWCLGESLVDYMLASDDPRLAVYAQEVGGNGSGNGYVGKPAGIANVGETIYGDSNNVSLIGEKYLEATQPAYFMSYAQLKLLMAEAAEKGYISGEASTYYAEGITASCLDNGVSTGSLSLFYSGGSTGLKQIAEQEWVALYMQGNESWAEYLRTGYPELPLAIDAVQPSIPSRYNYPGAEQSLNNANYTAAADAIGGDTLVTELWWQN